MFRRIPKVPVNIGWPDTFIDAFAEAKNYLPWVGQRLLDVLAETFRGNYIQPKKQVEATCFSRPLARLNFVINLTETVEMTLRSRFSPVLRSDLLAF